jgi:5'-3' exonuclease
MGIPSYFVHIVKQYPEIIKRFIPNINVIHNLYIDSNSIIYDAIQNIVYDSKDINYEMKVKKWVVVKLCHYISLIQPTKEIFIAFDGVAPVAKLEQQRNRRYKTWYINDFLDKNENYKKEMWDTTAITPGSNFMKTLSDYLNIYFSDKYKNVKISISDSNIAGEGEHKIYQYIRDNRDYHSKTTTVIYGLDADLIMLSLIHLAISPDIYLFRETPHFISSINSDLKPNELYVLDIFELDIKISALMHNVPDKNSTLDYIFLCFLLGNDFMPHFPALNIRTNGIQVLLDVYKKHFGTNNELLIKNNKIQWNNIRKLLEYIGKTEEELCENELKQRNKLEKGLLLRYPKIKDLESLTSIPILDRRQEKYINIGEIGWQKRYYKELFDIDIDHLRKQQICVNYLEGLEWTFKYYIDGCPDWKWRYKYKYPPLIEDLYKYTPMFDIRFIEINKNEPIDAYVQLSYVLPRNSLHLLPEKIYKRLIYLKPEWYRLDYKIIWAYCRYLWEAHVDLPEIDIDELTKIVNNTLECSNPRYDMI